MPVSVPASSPWIAPQARRAGCAVASLLMHALAWLLLGCLALDAQALPQVAPPVVALGTASGEMPIGRHVQVLEDPGGQRSLAEVMAGPAAYAWRPSASDAPNFGYTRSAMWLRTTLHNDAGSAGHWLLGLRYPLLDHVDLYLVRADGRTTHHGSGDRRPFASRPVEDRNFYFPLALQPGERMDVYVRIQTQGALQAPLVLSTPEAHAALSHGESWLMGIYAGALLAMLSYNLMLSLSLRDRTYLHYVVYVALFGIGQYVLNGLAYAHAWPAYPAWANLSTPIFLSLAGWSLVVFARDFLDLKTHWLRADRTLRACQWLFLAVVPATFALPYASAAKLTSAFTFVMPVMMLMVTVVLLRRGVRQARYFLAAFSVLLVGVVLTSMHSLGLVPSSLLTEHGLQVGSLLEFTLLSFALAHKLKLAREENERLQHAHAADLEGRVQARTRELNDALQQLTEAHKRLHELSEHDALTGLKNRMFLARQLGETWRHAQRRGEPLAALMIDIDHFKRINDEHGHLAGDEALRLVSHVIAQIVLRPGDHAVRYGGEEFLVLLPNTHLAGAAHVAEHIRRKVEALRMRFNDRPVPLTISVGVACQLATAEGHPQDLMQSADQLLYQAKQSGRNRCALHPESRSIAAVRSALKPAAAGRPAPASSAQS